MGVLDSVSKLLTGAYSQRDAKGRVWWLHAKKSAGGTMLYYFSSKQETAVPLPDGYAVTESKKTGLPLLRKLGS